MGGNEFRRDCDDVDRALLDLVGGPRAAIVILPTAATNENPYVAGENGIRHFGRLNARAGKLMIVDSETANQTDLAVAVEKHDLVYFTGGDPIYLLETLQGSKTWDSVLAVHARGGLIAGSSAGAMVLGGQVWRFDGWTAGLGLVPNVAILPHHATLVARWNGPAMAAALPPGVTLLGLDEATAVLLPEGQVLGKGEVTVYAPGGPQAYVAGGVLPPLSPLLNTPE
jgi:cyanophycinase